MIKKTLLLAISVFLTGCFSFVPKERWDEQFVIGDEKSSDKVLILPLTGVILNQEQRSAFSSASAVTPEKVNQLLQLAEKDKKIKAIILAIDSPGGGVTASDIIYRAIKEFKQKHPDKPIIALLHDTAASGGYYIAMACDYIIAHPTTITGSIGVISLFIILEDLMGKIGVQPVVVKSGKAKDIGSPLRKMTPEEVQFIQNIIDEMYNNFVEVVYQGRKNVLSKEEIKTLADGRILTGREAEKTKLVDSTGYITDAYKNVLEMAKLKSAKVFKYQYKKGGLFEGAFMGTPYSLELAYISEFVLRTNSSQFMYLWMPSLGTIPATKE
ncbi:MAG: signal peptide peptidase SppA [Planctomycetota bacterium]|nr:signal peptide peptidase SppA [Planctomycetota bacterium]MDI6787244.1 signal peptide peptidase SppA [Planctomycetota bacterium]